MILTVLSFTRWCGQLKRKVPNNEIRALSYNMVKYISENSKAAGYCSSSCQTQSRNIKNKGDWKEKQGIRFSKSLSQVMPFSLQLVLPSGYLAISLVHSSAGWTVWRTAFFMILCNYNLLYSYSATSTSNYANWLSQC